jgi:chromate transporter
MREVLLAFLRFGFTGFGGPIAHVAMFEEEFVRKRGWLTRERFLERMSLSKLIPGPNSTQLAMQLGFERAGWPGFFLAGFGFAAPAVLMVAALAELYRTAGGFSEVERWVWGTKPVVAALIVTALWRLCRETLRPSGELVAIATGFGLYCATNNAILALTAASGAWRLRHLDGKRGAAFLSVAALSFLVSALAPHLAGGTAPSVPALFGVMFYLGSIVVGSGYVLFSYFSSELSHVLGWADAHTVSLAIAAGQLTPGPLFASAVFFGQLLRGGAGGAACAAGIFVPAFLICGLSIPVAARLENSPWWKECLRVMAGVSVLILARETVRLAPELVDGWLAGAFFAVAAAALLRFRVNSSLLVVLGGLAGAFLR